MFGLFGGANIDKGVEEFNSTEGAVLVDVRSADEYDSGHIPGSINIELSSLRSIESVVPDKNTPLFVHCLSGMRSGSAVKQLKNMGYLNAENIGGMSSYTGPVEKGA